MLALFVDTRGGVTIQHAIRWTGAVLGLVIVTGATGYAFYVRSAFEQYGHPEPAPLQDYDALLQEFMPAYDVVDRHHVEVAAPVGALRDTITPVDETAGWVVLADRPGEELVMGAVARPWQPHAPVRRIAAADFAAFHEPGYVKIVWMVRADAITESTAMVRHETRALATDAEARSRYRQYWALRWPKFENPIRVR